MLNSAWVVNPVIIISSCRNVVFMNGGEAKP